MRRRDLVGGAALAIGLARNACAASANDSDAASGICAALDRGANAAVGLP